jgi:hypothetical protein
MSLGVSPALDATTTVIGAAFGPYQFQGQDRSTPTVNPSYSLYSFPTGQPYSSPFITLGSYVYSTRTTSLTVDTKGLNNGQITALYVAANSSYSHYYLYTNGYSISVTIPTIINPGDWVFSGGFTDVKIGIDNNSDEGYFYTLPLTTSQLSRRIRFALNEVNGIYSSYQTFLPGNVLLSAGARAASSPYNLTFTQSAGSFGFDTYLRAGQKVVITGASQGPYDETWNGTYVVITPSALTFTCSPFTGTTPPPAGSVQNFNTPPVYATPETYETLLAGPFAPSGGSMTLRLTVPIPAGSDTSPWAFTITENPQTYPQIANTVSLDPSSAFFLPYTSGNGTSTLVISGTVPSVPTTVIMRVNSYDAFTSNYISNIQSYFSFVNGTITVTPAIGNNIQLYLYEPFNYRFSFLNTGGTSTSNTLVGTSTDMLPYMTTDVSGVTFAKATGYSGIASSFGYPIAIQDSLGNSISTTVYVNPGRFYPPATTTYSFYRNEAITPIEFDSVANLSAYYVSPTLPVGYTFTSIGGSSNRFLFQGISPTTISRSSYTFIGSNTLGQIVTKTISLQVLPERLSLTAAPLSQTLTVGTPLATPTVFQSTIPTSAAGTMRYSWSTLPSGLSFQDVSGAAVTAPFYPADSNLTLRIAGTPTNQSSVALAAAGSNVFPTVVSAYAYGANGALSNTATVNFTYSETVMFSNATGLISSLTVPLTSGLAVPSGNSVTALTYYGTSSITSIYSPDLRSDLSLNVVGSTATLVGTSTSTGTGNYIIRAVNAHGVIGEIQMTIPVAPDIVTISGPVDACMNFVVGRPVSSGLPGYYTANPLMIGTSSAGLPVTITAPALAPTGITFTSGAFGGIPSTVTPLTSMVFTATDGLATTTKTIPIAVLDDVFTWNSVTVQFAQNRVRTPLQFTATTLSGLPIISYSVSGQPGGITMTNQGVLQGTCTSATSGTMVVSASTGFTTQTQSYPYTVAPDVLLLTSDQTVYPLPGTVQVTAVAYSGLPITNFTITPNPFGISVSSTGLIDGALISRVPPDTPVLPASYPMTLRAYASSAYGDVSATIVTENPYLNYALIPFGVKLYGYDTLMRTFDLLFTSPSAIAETKTRDTAILGGGATLVSSLASQLQRTTNGRTFTVVTWPFGGAYREGGSAYSPTIVYTSGSTWYLFFYFVSNGSESESGFWQQMSTDDGQTFPRWASQDPDDRTPAPGVVHYSDFFPQRGTYTYVSAQKNGTIVIGGSDWNIKIGEVTGTGIFLPAQYTYATTTLKEVHALDLNGSVFVAAGSDTYYLKDDLSNPTPGGPPNPVAATLHYSTNNGLTWATGTGDFSFMGMNVLYQNGVWLATGIDESSGLYKYSVRKSTDGQTWTTVTVPPAYTPVYASGPDTFIELGPIMYDDAWNILYTTPTTQVILRSANLVNWTAVTPTTPATGTLTRSTFGPPFWTAAAVAPSSTLVLGTNGVGTGPTILTPTTNGFQCMQFVTIAPIVVTSPETIFVFVDAATLPRGITFDPLTNTFSGTPVLTGNTTVLVRVKNEAGGLTTFPLYFSVYIPDVENKKQTSAAAFTSLVRQEVEIDGAQYARDTVANPTQAMGVGALMSPAPPTVTSATIPQNCTKTC